MGTSKIPKRRFPVNEAFQGSFGPEGLLLFRQPNPESFGQRLRDLIEQEDSDQLVHVQTISSNSLHL